MTGTDDSLGAVAPSALPRILRQGFDDFREFVNPMIALRARLAGEPTDVARVDAGRLLTAAQRGGIGVASNIV